MAPNGKDLLYYGIRLAIFIVSNISCFVAYAVTLTLLTPLRIWVPHVYWRIEQLIFFWLDTVCVSWVTFGGYKVFECGDDVNSLHDKSCLLLPNHQSTGDIPMVMLALHGKNTVVCKVMWIIYKLYKWSHFGLVCQHREDFFIDVGQSRRDKETAKFKSYLMESFSKLGKKWIVIFPEGGFLSRNQESSQRYARKNKLPDLKHVLLPRFGAVKIVLDTIGEKYDNIKTPVTSTTSIGSDSNDETPSISDALRNRDDQSTSQAVKWVIDMTIAYKDKEPLELLGMSIGYDPHKDVMVHWRTYRVKDIPRDEAALTAWLYQRYIEKEKMLDDYYKYNKIPSPPSDSSFPPMEPRYFKFDLLYQALVHVALFTLSYLEYLLILKPILSLIAYVFSFIFFFL